MTTFIFKFLSLKRVQLLRLKSLCRRPVMDPWLLCLLQCVKMVILQIDFHFQKWMKLWGGKSNEWACSEKLLHWCDQNIPALIVCSDLVIDDTLIFRGKLSGHYSRTVLTVSTWGTSSHCTTQWIFKTWCACSWTYSSHDAQPWVLETVDSSSETWLKLLINIHSQSPISHQQWWCSSYEI